MQALLTGLMEHVENTRERAAVSADTGQAIYTPRTVQVKGVDMNDIELRPLHCGISVSSLVDAVEWFERVLGFELDREADMSHLGFKIAFVRSGDFEVELFEHADSQPAATGSHVPDDDVRTRGTKHICFQVPDVDRLVEHFRANDVDIAMGPIPAAGLRVVFVHGPDDVLIEFAEVLQG